jgi:hypothetical protein
VLFMAKLEALSASESPADDDKEQLPVMFKPLCVSVSKKTVEHLSNLIERTSKLYFDATICKNEDYLAEM